MLYLKDFNEAPGTRVLNELGNQGWELSFVTGGANNGHAGFLIFKRPKP
jgi:hypothetical protein